MIVRLVAVLFVAMTLLWLVVFALGHALAVLVLLSGASGYALWRRRSGV